jgi:signal transduction histidine kinase
VSNALRHGRKGGLLRLGARRAKDERGRELLLVDVDDEGPGIAPADRERVFEAYWRGSEARQGEGSGLGLYIARSILRDHGWDLKASSAPGGGGRFTIAIPLDGRGEG